VLPVASVAPRCSSLSARFMAPSRTHANQRESKELEDARLTSVALSPSSDPWPSCQHCAGRPEIVARKASRQFRVVSKTRRMDGSKLSIRIWSKWQPRQTDRGIREVEPGWRRSRAGHLDQSGRQQHRRRPGQAGFEGTKRVPIGRPPETDAWSLAAMKLPSACLLATLSATQALVAFQKT
jgi:hypothetical protein